MSENETAQAEPQADETQQPAAGQPAMPEMGDGAVGRLVDADIPTDPALQPRKTLQEHAPEDFGNVPHQNPSIGRIVHYLAKDEGHESSNLIEGKIYPAVITAVHSHAVHIYGYVDLTVFGENASLYARTSMPWGHRWDWPPRV